MLSASITSFWSDQYMHHKATENTTRLSYLMILYLTYLVWEVQQY